MVPVIHFCFDFRSRHILSALSRSPQRLGKNREELPDAHTVSHQSHQKYQTVDCRSTSASAPTVASLRPLVDHIGAEAI